jgi:hypothetical protein
MTFIYLPQSKTAKTMTSKKNALFLVLIFLVPFFIISCQKDQQVKKTPETLANHLLKNGGVTDPDVTTDLIAAQNIDIGDVTAFFNEDGTVITVTYNIDVPGWSLRETNLDVQYLFSNLPTNPGGNPAIGQFQFGEAFSPSSGETSWTIDINLEELDPDDFTQATATIYLAAHAEVKYSGSGYGKESAWGDGEPFEGASWATFFECTYTGNGGCTSYLLATEIDEDYLNIYSINPSDGSAVELRSELTALGSGNYDANAYDAENNLFLFDFFGGKNYDKELYYYDLINDNIGEIGSLSYQARSASFYNGKYYYVTNGPSNKSLREVALAGTPLAITSESLVCEMGEYMDYGDIAITEEDGNAVLYGIGFLYDEDNNPTSNWEFFSVDLDGTYSYNSIKTKGIDDPDLDLQIAFGSDGTLYGVDSATGDLYEIDPATFGLTYLSTTGFLFSDLANGPCIEN